MIEKGGILLKHSKTRTIKLTKNIVLEILFKDEADVSTNLYTNKSPSVNTKELSATKKDRSKSKSNTKKTTTTSLVRPKMVNNSFITYNQDISYDEIDSSLYLNNRMNTQILPVNTKSLIK